MKDRLTTAPLPLDRPQCSCGTLNARSAIGKVSWPLERALAHLERPQCSCGTWNARGAIGTPRRATGTRLGASGTPAGLFCIVRWQDGIHPSIISVLIRSAIAAPPPGTRKALLERPPASWNARRPLGTPAGQLEQPQASGTPLGQWTGLRASGTEPSALPGTPAGLLEQSLRLYLERAWRSGITRIRRLRYRCYRCCRSQSRKARGHQLLPIKSPSHAVECTTILGDEISHLYLFNVAIRIEFSQLR